MFIALEEMKRAHGIHCKRNRPFAKRLVRHLNIYTGIDNLEDGKAISIDSMGHIKHLVFEKDKEYGLTIKRRWKCIESGWWKKVDGKLVLSKAFL